MTKFLSKDGKFYMRDGKLLGYIPPQPTLAANSSWYKGSMAKSTITAIEIKDSYTPTGTVTEQWNADVNNDGNIKSYVEDTKLTIAGNGAGKIMANADSSSAFNGFSAATSISGLNLLNTSKVTNMNYMFQTCRKLTKIYASGLWSTASVSVTSSTGMFGDCSNLSGAISYNSNKVDATYANYTTGYLTYKAAPARSMSIMSSGSDLSN